MNVRRPDGSWNGRSMGWLPMVAAAGFVAAGCVGPFDSRDFLEWEPETEDLHDIQRVSLEERSLTPPVSVEDATEDVIDDVLERSLSGDRLDLSLEEARLATLANNLDLRVELINPSIAAATVDEEEAKFESTFRLSGGVGSNEQAVTLATESAASEFKSFNAGVTIPLRAGGTITVDFPLNETEQSNLFLLVNPAYATNPRLSISQPLLRGAGNRANTHSIRVAKNQAFITSSRTKLETIRVLANVDRAYWFTYASEQELLVRQQQYELAMNQLDQAHRRVAAGDTAEIEVLRAQSGVAQRLEAIIIAETTMRRRQRDLKRLMNRDELPMNSAIALRLTTAPDPVSLDLDANEISKFAVENRMEMLELELQLAIDSSSIDFAKNARLPLVTLDYVYGLNGLGTTYNEALDQIGASQFEDWSVRLSAEIPIGNEAAKSRVHQAVLTRVQRLATRAQRKTAIEQEVLDAVDQLQQNWQRILAARQDALLAGRTYEAEVRQFQVGARTSTDVLDAATRLADAQSSEIRALTDYQIAQVDLAFATGTLLGHDRVRWEALDVVRESH